MAKLVSLRKCREQIIEKLCLHDLLEGHPTAPILHALNLALAAWFGFWSFILLPFFPKPHLGGKRWKDLAVVGASGEYPLALIGDMLDIARIEGGSIRAEIAPFDLYALIGDTVEMLRERAHAKHLELRSSI